MRAPLLLIVPLVCLAACGEKTAAPTSGSASSTSGSTGTSAPATSTAATAPPAATAAPVQAPPSDVPSAAASANVTMSQAELNGVKLKTISCKAANANPFTAIAMLGPVAKQKPALDACVDAPAEVSLHFSVSEKKASDIRVAGAPTKEAAACMAKALEQAPWAEDLVCVVKLDLKAAAAK